MSIATWSSCGTSTRCRRVRSPPCWGRTRRTSGSSFTGRPRRLPLRSQMTDKELSNILKKIKNERRGGSPHDVWVERSRGILLMQVKNTTDVNAKPGLGEYVGHLFSIFFPMEGFAMAARAIGVFLLVVGTVFGGGLVSAQVYQVATPGAFAYKVKLAVERAQLFLAPNEEYRTRLHTEFADHRLDEAAKLAEASPEMQALVPGVLDSFDGEIIALSAGLDARQISDPEGVAE